MSKNDTVASKRDLSNRRVVVLIQGFSRGLQHVKYQATLDALKKHFPRLEVWEIDVTGIRRWACILRCFHPNKTVWQQKFYSHPLLFEQFGKAFLRKRLADKMPVDAFVTFGLKFDAGRYAGDVPVITYTDYTTSLTARLGKGFRHPLSANLSRRRIRQERDAMHNLRKICLRSRFVAEEITKTYGISPEKIAVVGGGSNLPVPALSPRPAKPPGQPVHFLFVGRDFQRKGGDLVLAAFASLRKNCPQSTLAMVTTPVVTKLPEGVTLYHDLSAQALAELYRNADVFVLASRYETWGDVLIEAMSQGLPCVCPDIRPLDEIVADGRNGRLFNPGDANSLADAMIELCAVPDIREKMAAEAFEAAQTRFNWEIVALEIKNALAGILPPQSAD